MTPAVLMIFGIYDLAHGLTLYRHHHFSTLRPRTIFERPSANKHFWRLGTFLSGRLGSAPVSR